MSAAQCRPVPFLRGRSALPPVGILGGGQLGCMLAGAAGAMGLDVTVATDDDDAPAARGPHRVIHGALHARATLAGLARHARVATWESENTDVPPLASALPRGLSLVPGLAAMATLQHKLRQKLLLADLGIPSAPHVARDAHTPAAEWVARVRATFGGQAVLKWGRHGYDGKGVLVLGGAPGDHEAAVAFVRNAAMRDLPLHAEALVHYRRELSLVGTFAIEFFEDRHGTLLVNEIAPRVHNTGHWTLDAGVTSQFENHWRAVLGLPLGPTRPAGTFAMLNLLGPDGVDADASSLPVPQVPAGARLHWYGKTRVRPGRKMGHVNLVAADRDALVPLLVDADRHQADWRRVLAAPRTRPEAA